MDSEEKIKIFDKEIGYIKNPILKRFLAFCLSDTPDYFFEVQVSSTGKYHPPYAQGRGGLVRHTKSATAWYVEMYRPLQKNYPDEGVVAIVLHDTRKLGGDVPSAFTLQNHGDLAADFVQELGAKFTELENIVGVELNDFQKSLDEIVGAIRCHMFLPTWGASVTPETEMERMVCWADYCSSRKIGFEGFFDN